MRRLWPGVVLIAGSLAACGEDQPEACVPTTPCSCAEGGPINGLPDFSRARAGVAPEDADDAQRAALVRTNYWRTAAGLAPINLQSQMDQAAMAHSLFMATTTKGTCWPGSHNEINSPSCPGFTGADPGQRLTHAGYRFSTWGEVIDWVGTAEGAVDGWIWTVYHRMPFTSNNYTEAGFGQVAEMMRRSYPAHNTMDFGRAPGQSAQQQTVPIVFPPPGTQDVPIDFHGEREGPTPPPPEGRTWNNGPSGPVISVDFPSSTYTVTAHALYDVLGGCSPVDHSAYERDSSAGGARSRFWFMYSNSALAAASEYVVVVEGTYDGTPWRRAWRFRTH